MKRIIIFSILLFCFCLPVKAESVYEEQYSSTDIQSIYNALSNEAKDILDDFDIDLSDSEWYSKITVSSVFERLFDIFKGSLKEPMRNCAIVIASLLLCAGIATFADKDSVLCVSSDMLSVMGVVGVLIVPVCSLIGSIQAALKGSSVFMLSFIPVFCGLILLSGGTTVATVSSGMLISMAEVVGSAVSFVISPAVSAYIALGISASLTPIDYAKNTADTLKKCVVWGMSTAAASFSAVLSFQTAFSSATDRLSLKAARLLTSSVVPVVGGALSESLSTVAASFSLLKTSVGLIGVVGVVAVFLPVVIELLCYKAAVFAMCTVSGILSLSKTTDLLNVISAALNLMLAAILVISILFIVSLAVLLKAGGAV